MAESAGRGAEPPESAVTTAHVVYGLHGFAIAVGVLGSPTVIGSFVGSLPSIAAVILNYVKRGDARGTWVETHYRWQIRTFWFALLWAGAAGLLFLTVIGIPLAIGGLIGLTIWLIYRVARGWLQLSERRPMYAGGDS